MFTLNKLRMHQRLSGIKITLHVHKLLCRWDTTNKGLNLYNKTKPPKKFVSDLRQVDGFLRVLQFPPSIKLAPTI